MGSQQVISAQVESKVDDPHFHLSCIEAWMRPSHLPPLAGALPLFFSLSFLRPLTGFLTILLERGHPHPQHHRCVPKPANSREHQSAFHPAPDPKSSLPRQSQPGRTRSRAAPEAAAAQNVALPSLFGDDHFRLVPVKFQPQGPVAQVHLRFARHEAGLCGGELVERSSLVGVAVLLWVGVAGRGVALRRGVGQEAVVGSVGDDWVVGHVAAGAADGEGGVRGSVLAGVREHGTGSSGRRLWLARLREEVAICSRAIETVTKLRDPVQDRREFTSLDVPW